jgi:hypothetical protein
MISARIAASFSVAADAARDPARIFRQPGFVPPDFAHADTETVLARETRTFTATCTCARQRGTAPCAGSVVLQSSTGLA